MRYPKDIKPRNDMDQRHGYHEQYLGNDELNYKANYVNGELEGYCEWVLGNKIIFSLR